MFIKLGIIAGILVAAGLIFSSEINSIFPNTSASLTESLKDDVNSLGAKASESVENRLNTSLDRVVSKTSETIDDGIAKTQESSKDFFSNELTKINPVESLTNIFNTDSGNPENDSISGDDDSIRTQSTHPVEQDSMDVKLPLSTSQKPNGDIWLRYYDSTGNTERVDMTIRTVDREISLGTFYSSTFETMVNDISLESYYVDTIVDHKDYGKVSSRLFNSGDSNSVISGIFSKL